MPGIYLSTLSYVLVLWYGYVLGTEGRRIKLNMKISWYKVFLPLIMILAFEQSLPSQDFALNTEELDEGEVLRIDFSSKETIPLKGKPKIVGYNYYGYTYDSIIWIRYDEIKQYKTGRVVSINYQKGFVDETGKVLIPVSFEDISPLYDLEDSFLKTEVDPSIAYFNIKDKRGYGIVDELGTVLIPQNYDVPITNKGITYRNRKKLKLRLDGSLSIIGKKQLMVDRKGKLRGLCLENNCEGTRYVYRDIYWSVKGEGFIAIDTFQNRVLLDENGVVLEKRPSKEFRNWNGRYFYTVKTGSAGIYDLLKRSWLIDPNKIGIGLGFIEKGRFIFRKNQDTGGESTVVMIDTAGKIIIPEGICDKLQLVQNADLIVACKESECFVLDLNGKTLIAKGEYDEISVYNGLILLKKGSKYGVLHPLELVIYPSIIDEFISNPETADLFMVKIDGEEKRVIFDLRAGKYLTKSR